jgi:hypothetical protein
LGIIKIEMFMLKRIPPKKQNKKHTLGNTFASHMQYPLLLSPGDNFQDAQWISGSTA